MILQQRVLIKKNVAGNEKSFSVAKVILAVLWRIKDGNTQMFIKHPYARYFCSNKKPVSYRSSLSRLEQYGLIHKENKRLFSLTPIGKKEALFVFVDIESVLHVPHMQKWDQGWRIIFFEMPPKKKKFQYFLQNILKRIGFHELLQGVWIYPYQAPLFLRELLLDDTLKQYVKSIATSIEHDQDLREIFKLQQRKEKKKSVLFNLF